MDLDFRCGTAFFADLGIEWDLTAATDDELARLRAWIAAFRDLRGVLHGGRTVQVDLPGAVSTAVRMHGVVSHDRSEAVFAHVQLDEQVADVPPLRARGLDPAARYRVRVLPDGTGWAVDGLEVGGAALAELGLPGPPRRPLSAHVVHLARVTG